MRRYATRWLSVLFRGLKPAEAHGYHQAIATPCSGVGTEEQIGELSHAMDEPELIKVSPRHSVRLAQEYAPLIRRAPQRDFVVRTLAHREANGLPLMTAELVIAGRETRESFPLAHTYPLHFRKTYFPGRFHAEPEVEFQRHTRATTLIDLPPAIGWSTRTFRSCFLPGKPYNRLSPFGVEPEESNLSLARELGLAAAAGLWRIIEEAFAQLQKLHAGGLAHGDLELHNLIVSPAPLEPLLIDFGNSVERSEADVLWQTRCDKDFTQLLREAIFLQCALGRQPGGLADLAWEQMEQLLKAPERFRREMSHSAEV